MSSLVTFLGTALRSLMEDLEAGTEEGVRIEVERMEEEGRRVSEEKKKRERDEAKKRKLEEQERMQKERVETERRKKINDETAFWTTPGSRPLAEPPVLDWGWFFRLHIPSDLRYRMLFPDDPEKRCRIKDVNGERAVLAEYRSCVYAMKSDPEMDISRSEFFKHLEDELSEDWKLVDQEYKNIYFMATELQRFDYMNLDNYGRTTGLEQWVERGADIFHARGDEVREKYQHLVPVDFVENRLATFEFCWLDWDGGTSWLQSHLRDGNDVLAEWPQEVQDKYGHFRCHLSSCPDR